MLAKSGPSTYGQVRAYSAGSVQRGWLLDPMQCRFGAEGLAFRSDVLDLSDSLSSVSLLLKGEFVVRFSKAFVPQTRLAKLGVLSL